MISRASNVSAEVTRKQGEDVGEAHQSVLGCIHLDLAIYHETCRFDVNIQDTMSAHFHLKSAADCGNLQALIAISSLYLGLPNDVLPGLNKLDIEDLGLDYLVCAANQGDVNSMLFLAKAFDCGLNLGTKRSQSYSKALKWYEVTVNVGVDKRYLVLARMAEIMLLDGLECKDVNKAGELYSEAAEAAMEEMCGKLANKYYALSEEAWAIEEEEE